MILNKLILNNIKSYKYEEINFNSGINCVLGLNGSGKTTIIESIGLALFNFKKASSFNSLLRYNESKGSIELYFTANDSREYKIVRQIRKNNSPVKIIDCENDTELYNTVEDVYKFVQKILNISKAREFSKLFEQVIAVPQGQYVNAFLETPAKRKENFDRLFGLHIYKNIADRIKIINDSIKNEKIVQINEELKLIEGKTINYSRSKKQLNELHNELKELETKVATLEEEKRVVFEKKTMLENIKKNIDSLIQDNKIKEANLKNYQAEKNRLDDDCSSARKAAKIVSDNLSAFLKYQENLDRIRVLEKTNSENEKNSKILNQVQTDIKLNEKDIENKKIDLSKKNKALEEKSSKYEEQLKTLYLNKTAFDEDNQHYINQEKEYTKNVVELDEKISQTTDQLMSFNLTYAKIEETNYINDNLITDLKAKSNEIELKISSFNKTQEKINELTNTLNILRSKRENNFNNAKLTEGGICPFLNEQCKNINGENLSSYFLKLMEENDEEINQVVLEINKLNNEISDKRFVEDEKSALENRLSTLNNDLSRREKIINDFTSSFKELISPEITFNENLSTLISDKSKELEDLKIQKNELDNVKNNLINKQNKLSTNEFRVKQLEIEILNIEKDIKGIKNDISTIEFDIKQLMKTKSDLLRSETELKIKLKDSDQNIETLNKCKEENIYLQEAKDLYNINIDKSKELQKIMSLIENNNLIIVNLENNIKENNDKLALLNDQFSDKELDELNKRYNFVIIELSKTTAKLEEKKATYVILEEDVNNMEVALKQKEVLLVKLNSLKRTVDFLVYMRELYSKLPQELSYRYREYVSYMATNSYRKISKESVYIEISDDYELRLVDDYNDKNIKTIDQLSGGEQMSIALAVRFSMMKQLSGLDIYFLDEPTINLDYQRRNNISDVVSDISKELSQLFIISHDDTFDDITERIIKVVKESNVSRVE